VPHSSNTDRTLSGHVAALDGVRGAAILIVLIHNAAYVLKPGTAFLPKLAGAIAATGWIGVQLFFVLSGLLITGILLDTRGNANFFRDFYVRRTLRIFPLYYGFLIVALLVLPAVIHAPAWVEIARKNQMWFWTYTSNWVIPFGRGIPYLSHFWSLAVEEQFYLMWPVVTWALGGRKLLGLSLALVAITPFLRLALVQLGLPSQTAYEFTFARWDALALGAAIAIALRSDGSRVWMRRHVGRIAGGALASLLALVVIRRGFHSGDIMVQVIGQTLVAILSGAIILFCVAPQSRLAATVERLARMSTLRFFGNYSYALYVFHFPIDILLRPHLADAVNGADSNWRVLRLGGYVGLVMALSVLAALISWRLLEKPFLDLKERWALRPDRAPMPPAP
jgi:peptidoglycan/LPS O-acetylase OafA/YrhL